MAEQENNSGKIEVKFKAAVKSIAAVLGGESKLISKKTLKKDDLQIIVDELFVEEKKENLEIAKKELKEILSKYAEMKKQIAEKEREIKKMTETKMEEFTKTANSLLHRIIGLSELEKDYYDGLNKVVNIEKSKED